MSSSSVAVCLDAERPYKTFGYPVTPLFFIAVAAWFVVNTFIEQPQQAVAGLSFLALGVPVYCLWKNRSRLTPQT
ncbi:MAG: hypothetical protein C4326_13905 [Ignavibacteria bacterium]